MMRTRITFYICAAIFLAGLFAIGCKKDFLDQKPDKSLLVPTTTADMQALLDNLLVFNQTPGLTNLADGDLEATDAGWNGYPKQQERATYTWSADIFGSETGFDWNAMYQQVFYANIALQGLDKLPAGTENSALRGQALFHRAYAFFNLAQMFAAPYRAATAMTEPGIPLKISPVVTEKVGRGTLADTYAQVITDLKTARRALPLTVNYKSRPSRAAAYGLLARVYLVMENYPMAGKYADSCLQLRHELTDYNSLSTTAARPFPPALPNGSPEVIFYSAALTYRFVNAASPTYFTQEFYGLFGANDLRKVILFRQAAPGAFKFKGSYGGVNASFSGLGIDEMYLIRAECAARAGDKDAALNDLNALLVKRWVTGTYQPVTAADAEAALRMVVTERRKELTQRGIRWMDLRRLNHDPRFAVTLSRALMGQVYTLDAESKRYTYPIAQDELLLNPNPQNER
jgi:tetratricopeptide (TPR) repeat protein